MADKTVDPTQLTTGQMYSSGEDKLDSSFEVDAGYIPLPEQPMSERAMNMESGLRSYWKSMGQSEQDIDSVFKKADAEKEEYDRQRARKRYELKVQRGLLGQELDDQRALDTEPPSGSFEELAGFNEFAENPDMISPKTPARVPTDLLGRFDENTGVWEYGSKQALLGLTEIGSNLANYHLTFIEAERKGEELPGLVGFLQKTYKLMKLPLESIPFIGDKISEDVENGMIKAYGDFMDHAFGDNTERSVEEILENRIPRRYIPTGPEALDLSNPQNAYRMIGNIVPTAVAGIGAVDWALKGVSLSKSGFAMLRASSALKKAGQLTKADRLRSGAMAVKNLKAMRAANKALKTASQVRGVPTATKAVKGAAKIAGKGAQLAGKGAVKAAPFAKGITDFAVSGAIAETVSFRKEDWRLAHFLQDMEWGDAWGTMVVAEPWDTEAEMYNKQLTEAATISALIGLLGKALKGVAKTLKPRKGLKTISELDKIAEGEKLVDAVDDNSRALVPYDERSRALVPYDKNRTALAKLDESSDLGPEGSGQWRRPDEGAIEAAGERQALAAKKAGEAKEGALPALGPEGKGQFVVGKGGTKTETKLKSKPKPKPKPKNKTQTPEERQSTNRKDFIKTHNEYKKATKDAVEETPPAQKTKGVVEETPPAKPTVEDTAKSEVDTVINQSDEVVESAEGVTAKTVQDTGESIIVAVARTAKETGEKLGDTTGRFLSEDLPPSLNPKDNKLFKQVLDKMRVSPKAFAMLRKYLPVGELNRLSNLAKKAFSSGEGIPFNQLTPEQQQLFKNMGFNDYIPSQALQETLTSTRIMLAVEDEIMKHSHSKLAKMVEARKALEKLAKAGDADALAKLDGVEKKLDEFWDDMMHSNYVTDKINGVFSVAGHFLQSAVGRTRQKLAAKMRNKLQSLLDDGSLSKAQMQDEYLKFAKSMKIDKIDYDNFVGEKLKKHSLELERAKIQQEIDLAWEKYGADDTMIAKREARIKELKKLAKDNGCG